MLSNCGKATIGAATELFPVDLVLDQRAASGGWALSPFRDDLAEEWVHGARPQQQVRYRA